MQVTKDLYKKKDLLLNYLRDRANELFSEIIKIYGQKDYKDRASEINKEIKNTTNNIIAIINQRANSQSWIKNEIIQNILMVTYCSYIVMIEFRNYAWPYEYMTFSRRIGELWEPFCKLCFNYPINTTVELIEPPLFSDVKNKLYIEINEYINQLKITSEEKRILIDYYDKVWSLVTSGEIKLKLDLHILLNSIKYNIDFKSGFQSNEKGNTNRLLLVASIYKNIIGENNECLIFVRAKEEENNHYLQTLKNSGIWNVYCGIETYDKIKEFSGFDILNWISTNIDWENDFSKETIKYFKQEDLVKYLSW